jgi:hypothetical protein
VVLVADPEKMEDAHESFARVLLRIIRAKVQGAMSPHPYQMTNANTIPFSLFVHQCAGEYGNETVQALLSALQAWREHRKLCWMVWPEK